MIGRVLFMDETSTQKRLSVYYHVCRATQVEKISLERREQKHEKGATLMAKARWNGVTLAESEQCLVLEGNYYFPPDAVHREYLRESKAHSLCFWKGLASYYDIEVEGKKNTSAAWYYPHPSPLARRIKEYVAFWNGVEIEG